MIGGVIILNNIKKNQIGLNMMWNAVSIVISMVIAFTLTPYVTKHIGIEATGFISLSNTIVAYIDIIAIALNAFASRNIAIAYHNGNNGEVNIYYNSVIIANAILSLLINLVCIYVTLNLQQLLNVSNSLLGDVKILFFIMILNYTINIFGSIFSIAAFITNNTAITYRNKGFSSMLYAVTLVILINFNSIHVYFVAIGYLVAAIYNLITNFYYTKKLLPDLKFSIHLFSFSKIKILISSGIWNSISNIGVMLNTGLDLLVSNKMLSVIIMGQISVSKQLSSMMTLVTSIIVNSFQPKQLEKYVKNDIEGLVNYLNISIKLSSVLSITLFSAFLILGKPFLLLWLPGQDIDYIYTMSLIVIFGDIVVSVVRPLYYVFTLTDNLKIICFFTVLSGMLNFISMILLLSYTNLGGYAVVGTTCILNFMTNLMVTPYLAVRFLNLRKNPFYSIIIKHLLICILVSFIFFIINNFFVVNTWFKLLISGSINCIILVIIVSFMILSKKEKILILKNLKKEKGREKE